MIKSSTRPTPIPNPRSPADILLGMSQHVAQPDDNVPMGRTYALVIACHAAVITLLWLFGHTFSA